LALLESELGSQLLVRTTRSQLLTATGEQLFGACKPHIEALKSAETSISDFIRLPKGQIKNIAAVRVF
jgi:DNA-binding transcriptional LysR family regulator